MESDCTNTSSAAPGVYTKLSDIPEISVLKYAEARAQELDAIDSAARKTMKGKKSTQSVPNHMRRRAASHNIKRLPKRLRDKAVKEMKDAPPKKTKRPSRKHRRRPSNLLQEYNRRKKTFMWLETHIWHAKRFHMQKQWGYNVAQFPNDKSLRACYRASVRHCLMWDMSYLACLEIYGRQRDIVEGLLKITSPSTGSGIGSVAHLSGSVEGTTFLYHIDQYPSGAIGPATFLWKPTDASVKINEKRTLWLWLHPMTFDVILKELQVVFNAVPVPHVKTPTETLDPTKRGNISTDGEKTSTKQAIKIPKDDGLKRKYPDIDVATYKDSDVEIVSLKDTLCRFRLMGPESQAILTDVLQTAEVSHESNGTRNEEKQKYWWMEIFSKNEAREIHLQQKSAWKQIANLPSCVYLPPHTVLGLTVKDPRLRLPEIRTKVTRNDNKRPGTTTSQLSDGNVQPFQWPDVSYSPLWETTVRNQVKYTKLSEQEINARRAENLIPGQSLDLGCEESRIPVLLIQRPGRSVDSEPVQDHWSLGVDAYGSGWDIILPGGWAMAFWIALVYRGARVGGIRELVNTDLELGQIHFPDYNPDTLASRTVAKDGQKELEENHKKKPPAKRPNYHKLGVAAPFHCPWDDISKSQDDTTSSKNENQEVGVMGKLFVLRNKSQLYGLHTLLSSLSSPHLSAVNNRSSWTNMLNTCHKDTQTCLVAVHLQMLSRGICKSFALIYYPSETDLSQLATDTLYEGPVEKIHKPFKSGLIATNVNSLVKSEQLQSSAAVRPDRDVCGCICDGGFSLHLGKGAGLGYVTLSSLYKLINTDVNRKPLVLVRCPASRQYRFASVAVLPNSRVVQL